MQSLHFEALLRALWFLSYDV